MLNQILYQPYYGKEIKVVNCNFSGKFLRGYQAKDLPIVKDEMQEQIQKNIELIIPVLVSNTLVALAERKEIMPTH